MSSRNAAAFFQSTVAPCPRQGIATILNRNDFLGTFAHALCGSERTRLNPHLRSDPRPGATLAFFFRIC